MNALDKAFIKAYAKGAVGDRGTAVLDQNEPDDERTAAAVQNRVAMDAGRLSALVEVSAADGVWYRIEQPSPALETPLPQPHFAPQGSAGRRLPPEAAPVAASNRSAVEALDSLLGLSEAKGGAEEAPAMFARIDLPPVRREGAKPDQHGASLVLAAHELEAFLQGAAASVVAQGWEGDAVAAPVESLCECWQASDVFPLPVVIEQTWVESAPRKSEPAPEPLCAAMAASETTLQAATAAPAPPSSNAGQPTPNALPKEPGADSKEPSPPPKAAVATPPAPVAELRAPPVEPSAASQPSSGPIFGGALKARSGALAAETASPKSAPAAAPRAPQAGVSTPSAAPAVASPKIYSQSALRAAPAAPLGPPKQPPAKPRAEAASPGALPSASQPEVPKPQAFESEAPKTNANTPSGFQAAWEVDRLNWPEECDKLARGDAFGPLAKTLVESARRGKKVIAVTGACRGEGRTTLALCLARRAAKEEVQVALLDADFERPHLGRRIGIDMENGWDDVLTDGQPLSEAAVASLEDRLTVLPLGRRAAACVSAHTVAALRQASEAFDLVVVDMGPVTEDEPAEPAGEGASAVAALVVHDRRSGDDDLARTLDRLRAAGIEALGVVETFA